MMVCTLHFTFLSMCGSNQSKCSARSKFRSLLKRYFASISIKGIFSGVWCGISNCANVANVGGISREFKWIYSHMEWSFKCKQRKKISLQELVVILLQTAPYFNLLSKILEIEIVESDRTKIKQYLHNLHFSGPQVSIEHITLYSTKHHLLPIYHFQVPYMFTSLHIGAYLAIEWPYSCLKKLIFIISRVRLFICSLQV